MIILGVDPGLATIGYGVIEINKTLVTPIDYGVILTPKDMTLPERLLTIEKGMNAIIDKFKPDQISMEELFFNNNAKTAIAVAEARGVIVNTCYKYCKELFEYTPLQIKQTLTGYGRAEKKQIQYMVTTLLKLKCVPKPDDAADALAVALTHFRAKSFANDFSIR